MVAAACISRQLEANNWYAVHTDLMKSETIIVSTETSNDTYITSIIDLTLISPDIYFDVPEDGFHRERTKGNKKMKRTTYTMIGQTRRRRLQ